MPNCSAIRNGYLKVRKQKKAEKMTEIKNNKGEKKKEEGKQKQIRRVNKVKQKCKALGKDCNSNSHKPEACPN